MADTSIDNHHGHAPNIHITPLSTYFLIFGALSVGTILTVVASRMDLGMMNTPIAIFIATIKMALVILYFMHVIHSTRLTWVTLGASFLWLAVLFLLTFADYLTRHLSMY